MTKTNEVNIDKIIDKVKKILALSSNNPSEEEAQAAALKVQKLLAEYNLSMSDLDTNEEFKPAIEEVYTGVDKSFKYLLANTIADNFRCKTYVSGNRRQIYFFGHEADCKIAREVFQYLFKTCDKSARREGDRAERKYGTRKGIYYSYTRGFCHGVKEALDEQCKALMIVTPPEVNNSWEDYKTKIGMKEMGGNRNGSEDGFDRRAYDRGVTDGSSAMRDKQTKQITN